MTNINEDLNQPFKVFVRVRPFNEKEIHSIDQNPKKQNKNFLNVSQNQIVVNYPEGSIEFSAKKEKTYYFDEIFQESFRNIQIFDKVIKNMVDNVLLGYNSTALAFGVTGAGKTHTMFGDIYNQANQEKGICTYAIEYLYDKILKEESNKSFQIKISYLEIYNEQVIDLLSKKTISLMIIEDPVKGIVVPELSEYNVNNTAELINLIVQGNSERTMAPTGQNQFSSRSHAILQIVVEQVKKQGESVYSKFLMVDLAGSERGAFEKGIRLQEGSNINKSLLALGNCINLLSDKSKKGSFIPYRDSKLTRLLKDSLGGNILTIMIACISPSFFSYDDTINTLNYAFRARKIQKKITKNIRDNDINSGNYRELIYSLKLEINQLKEIIRNQNILIHNNNQDNVINSEKPIIQNTYSNIIINNINTSANDLSNNPSNNKKNMNKYTVKMEIYENFLIKCSSASEMSYDDLELFVDNLQYDKIFLEEQIEKGVKDDETTNNYMIIKSYYEKYLEIINDKMVDNIEQNLILNINLKEINELNKNNQMLIEKLTNQKENLETNQYNTKDENVKEISNINEEIKNTNNIIFENEKVKERIQKSLEKNTSNKKNLKSILLKLISNSSKKEVTDWHQAYRILEKENKDLVVKNYRYKTYISTVLKEKELFEQKYEELMKEYEKCKVINIEKTNKYENIENILKEKFAIEDEKNRVKRSRKRNNKYKSCEQNTSLKFISQSKTAKFIFFNDVSKEEKNILKDENKKNKLKITEKKLRQELEKLIKEKNFNLNTNIPVNEKIDIDIQKITPLSNFKINFETCQFHRLETRSKKTILKTKSKEHLDNQLLEYGKKIKKRNTLNEKKVFINTFKPTLTNNNHNNITVERKHLNPSPRAESVIDKNKLEFTPNKNPIVESNRNTAINNLNTSLSISKVTIRNEICYNPEYEVIDNFLNSELIDDLKNIDNSVYSYYNNYEKNEDHMIINQLNDLIQNSKSTKNNLNDKIFSKVPHKKSKSHKHKDKEISRLNSRENSIKLTDVKHLEVSLKDCENSNKRKKMSHSPKPVLMDKIHKSSSSELVDNVKFKDILYSTMQTIKK